MLSYTILVLVSLVIFALWFSKRWYTYWKRKGVVQLEPIRFFYGNMDVSKLSGVVYKDLYDEFKRRGLKYGGIYSFFRRDFLPTDVSLIKAIMQKDFMHFQSSGTFSHEKDILSQQLLNMWGEKWKSMRSKLTPALSSGKVKFMFETMTSKSKNLVQQTEKLVDSPKPVDIKDLMARYTIDVIVTAAFGVECDSLENPENNYFRELCHWIFKFDFWSFFGFFVLEGIVPWPILGHLGYKSVTSKKAEDFFVGFVKQLTESRKVNNIERNDFFDSLLKLKTTDVKGFKGITDIEVVAQSFLFYLGGFETTATTLSFALLHAARHPELQEKCRKEVRDVLNRHNGKLSYEAAQEMLYVDQFIQETLRITPPFLDLLRECTKDYQVPDSDLIIKKGTKVVIPVYAVHMDPDLYPNPSEFNPDNFSKENKQNRPDFSFLTFGEGPRMCLGLRFGYLNVRVAFASMVNNFEVKLNSKTHLPIVFDPNEMAASVKGGIWLDFKKLN